MNTFKLYDICCEIFGKNNIEKGIINEIRDNVNDIYLLEYEEMKNQLENAKLDVVIAHKFESQFITEKLIRDTIIKYDKIFNDMFEIFGDESGFIFINEQKTYIERCNFIEKKYKNDIQERIGRECFWRWYHSLNEKEKKEENQRYYNSLKPKECLL